LIPDSIPQFFAEPNQHISGDSRLIYRPALMAKGRLMEGSDLLGEHFRR